MNQADGVIEMPAAKRKTSVPRFDRFVNVLLEILLEIEEHDFAPRRHDVADHALAEIERVHEEIAPQLRDFIGLFALVENQPQFLFTMRQLGAGYRFDS